MLTRRLIPVVALCALMAVSITGFAAAQESAQIEDEPSDESCHRVRGKLVCEGSDAGPGGDGDGGSVPVPPDAIWFVFYNPAGEGCYAVGWERPGGDLGYDGWSVLTEVTFPLVMGVLTWVTEGSFTWDDFDADGDGRWDGSEATDAANALFVSFDVEPCAAPPTDTPWVLSFIETLDFTAGSITTAPPGDPVAGWPAYVTLEPDYGPLGATGGVVVDDADGSTSVRWDLTNPHSGNTITVTADPVYRVYWEVDRDPGLYTQSHRGDLTWPTRGEGELAHEYQVKGERDLVAQVRWQVEWSTPVASGTEEFVRETPHQWRVREYQAVVEE